MAPNIYLVESLSYWGGMTLEPYVPQNLPPDGIDWKSHIPNIGKANAALARYDGIIQGIVNPDILLSPLTTNEAVLSSKIEGTRVSLEDVLKYEADSAERFEPNQIADIHEVINYRKAMSYAVTELKTGSFDIDLITNVHKILLSGVRGKDHGLGKIRRVQNWIGLPNTPMEMAIFVPPAPDRVPAALKNWEEYLNAGEIDTLVQLAVLKAQFELIHPFADGNGRIGRMLVPLILYHKNMLSKPVFYISSYFERNKPAYYDCLLRISRDGDWDTWISFFLRAIIEQSNENNAKAKEILDLYRKIKEEMPGIMHTQYSTAIIDSIFSKPIFSTPSFVARTEMNKVSAFKILNLLVDAGILKVMAPGKARRPTVYAFSRLLDITEKTGP